MNSNSAYKWLIGCFALGVVLIACVGGMSFWGVSQLTRAALPATPAPAGPTLELAYSPEKEQLVLDIVAQFNRAGYKTPDGQTMQVVATKMEAADMVDAARGGRFTVVTPDSTFWLAQIDAGLDRPLVGESTRYAVTPVVIATWSDTARSMGYPNKALGWQDLLNRARSDPNFKWSHPSTSSASGLLATLAEFYAGAGKTRGLTEADLQNKATLDYVAALEKTVRYYGEGEQATIEQVLAKGKSYLDAFVVSERLVIYFNSKSQDKLVAIYPVEGTAWQDHPLALLEQPNLSDDQRLTFRQLRDFVLSPQIQKAVLQAGYRPVDLNMRLDDPASPIKTANGVDPAQPQTTLQMPTGTMMDRVQSAFYLTKRPANIYLVADTSGSMDDEDKLTQAQGAFSTFLDQIQGPQDRVGLVPFSSNVYRPVPLEDIVTNRDALKQTVNGLQAGGNTALLDAVNYAYSDLQKQGDRDRINAIVVMTDGLENASSISQSSLVSKIKNGNKSGVQVLIFCIAYGSDADLGTLSQLSDPTGGFARRADPDTIRKLYKILSTYF